MTNRKKTSAVRRLELRNLALETKLAQAAERHAEQLEEASAAIGEARVAIEKSVESERASAREASRRAADAYELLRSAIRREAHFRGVVARIAAEDDATVEERAAAERMRRWARQALREEP